ncbi:MAG: tetratricopeptide repeat protein [Myxococcales bacterium]|nr:tetratricopeptide repeat protein [Myxococcales bacterium]
MRPLRPLSVAFGLLLLAGAARGEDDPATQIAKANYRRGSELFRAERWEEARREFEAALRVKPLAAFHYNIARCYEHEGRPEDAVVSYRTYLQADPEAVDGAEVRLRIVALQRQLDAARIVAPPVVVAPRTEAPPRRRIATWVLAAGTVALLAGGASALGVAGARYPTRPRARADSATTATTQPWTRSAPRPPSATSSSRPPPWPPQRR